MSNKPKGSSRVRTANTGNYNAVASTDIGMAFDKEVGTQTPPIYVPASPFPHIDNMSCPELRQLVAKYEAQGIIPDVYSEYHYAQERLMTMRCPADTTTSTGGSNTDTGIKITKVDVMEPVNSTDVGVSTGGGTVYMGGGSGGSGGGGAAGGGGAEISVAGKKFPWILVIIAAGLTVAYMLNKKAKPGAVA